MTNTSAVLGIPLSYLTHASYRMGSTYTALRFAIREDLSQSETYVRSPESR